MPPLFTLLIASKSLLASGHFCCFGNWHIFMAMATLAAPQQRRTSLPGLLWGNHSYGGSSSAPFFSDPSISLPCWLWVGLQDGTLRTGPWYPVAFQSARWPDQDLHASALFLSRAYLYHIHSDRHISSVLVCSFLAFSAFIHK